MKIQLSAHLKAKVTKTAQRRGITSDRLVKSAIEQNVQSENGAESNKNNLFDRSIDLCGSVDGHDFINNATSKKSTLKGYGQWKP